MQEVQNVNRTSSYSNCVNGNDRARDSEAMEGAAVERSEGEVSAELVA